MSGGIVQATSDQSCGECQETDGYFGILNDSGFASAYLHSGEFFLSEVDLAIPGRGMNWKLSRKYRSRTVYEGPLGHNWELNYNRRIVEANASNLAAVQAAFPEAEIGDVARMDGNSRADLFVRDLDGSYSAPTGFYTTLEKNGDGTLTERDYSGNVVVYAEPDDEGIGRMTSLSDRNGNSMRFEYEAGQLSRVVDTLGRPIEYEYEGDRLTEVRDFLGRTITFEYDTNGDLEAVTGPAVEDTPNGNNFPDGKTTRYAYASGFADERLNHNLLTITAPNEVARGGPPRIVVTYENDTSSPFVDMVTSQTEGGTNVSSVPAGGIITYDYEEPGSASTGDFTSAVSQTTVTDRNGNQTEYQFNQLGNIVRIREFTNRNVRPNDPPFFETRYEYNKEGELLKKVLPDGNFVDYEFDDENTDRLQQGNQLVQMEVPDERGGDQTSIKTRSTYEPIYNKIRSATEARGNDPTYVPQNGGATSPERYTTRYTFDYEESCDFAAIGGKVGRTVAEVEALLSDAGMCAAPLGDLNGDGVTNQVSGNAIRAEYPTVQLLPDSNLAAVAGSSTQEIVYLYAYNQFGQLISETDPEGNVTTYEYYPESDPNGDGQTDNPDGSDETGGYLKMATRDTTSHPDRDSGTNPPPTNIRGRFEYDPVGNLTRLVDGRGVATDYVVNELNQVVQVVGAADHNVFEPDPPEPLSLTDFRYLRRTFYDFNDNVVLTQVEDRGNTSNVDGNPPPGDLPDTAANPDPSGGPAFVDTVYKYDILDNQVQTLEEVRNGAASEFLTTRSRYDGNENQVLVIRPEDNATSSVYDERDLLFQSTRGALSPPLVVNLAASDLTDYDVRGGEPSTMTYHYDVNRNLSETADAEDTDGSAANNSDLGGAGDRMRYIYDGFDRRTSEIDAVGNQTVYQYDPASNVARVSRFGPVDGPSPTSDGPDTLALPVSKLGVIQAENLVDANLLESSETFYDELNRSFQTDRVLFVNTIPTVRAPDVADGATDIGKGDLTPGDDDPIPGVSGVAILGRVSSRTEFDRNSRATFTVQDDEDTYRAFYDGADRVTKTVDPEGNTVETVYDDNDNVIETRETDVSQPIADSAGTDAEPAGQTSLVGDVNCSQTVNSVDASLILQLEAALVDSLACEDAGDVNCQDGINSVDGSLVLQLEAALIDSLAGCPPTPTPSPTAPPTPEPSEPIVETFLTTSFYDSLGRTEQTTDNLGQTMHYRYDSRDNTVAMADAQGPMTGASISRRHFPKGDRTVNEINDFGNVTLFQYDGINRKTRDDVVLTDSGQGDGGFAGADEFGVKTGLAGAPDPTQGGGDGLITIRYEWDRNSLQLSLTDDNGNQTRYGYDNLNRRVTETKGVCVAPNLADRCDPPTTITWEYDADDNLGRFIDENSTVTECDFDGINRAGACIVTRAPGVIGTTLTTSEYDGLSRLTRATDNNEPSDAADDSVITFARDSLSRTLEETQQIGSLPAKAIGSAWRAEDLRSRLTYPNGRAVDYRYDGLDRLDTAGDQGAAQPIADYDFIGLTRVLQRSYPQNGTRMTFLDDAGQEDAGYDGLRRPVQLRHLRSDDSLVVGFTHDYDRTNNKLSEAKLHDPTNSEVYGYDSAYRLIDFERPDPSSIQPLHDDWVLDGVGNWQEVASTESGSAETESRQHSSFNELIQRGDGSSIELDYDANGNTAEDGTYEFQWDYENRLRKVTRTADDSLVATYAYDAADRRIRKVVASSGQLDGTTDFYLDGLQEIEERDGSDSLRQQYVYGAYIDEPLVVDKNEDGDASAIGGSDIRLFYHQNTLFSSFALTDTRAAIVEGYQYDAYGRQTVYEPGLNTVVDFSGDDIITAGASSALQNPYLYTGRRLDSEAGLYYSRTRYLLPRLGRFASRDGAFWNEAIAFGNPYSYVGNRAATYLDPLGERALAVEKLKHARRALAHATTDVHKLEKGEAAAGSRTAGDTRAFALNPIRAKVTLRGLNPIQAKVTQGLNPIRAKVTQGRVLLDDDWTAGDTRRSGAVVRQLEERQRDCENEALGGGGLGNLPTLRGIYIAYGEAIEIDKNIMLLKESLDGYGDSSIVASGRINAKITFSNDQGWAKGDKNAAFEHHLYRVEIHQGGSAVQGDVEVLHQGLRGDFVRGVSK